MAIFLTRGDYVKEYGGKEDSSMKEEEGIVESKKKNL
jgi:hypothetical protein